MSRFWDRGRDRYERPEHNETCTNDILDFAFRQAMVRPRLAEIRDFMLDVRKTDGFALRVEAANSYTLCVTAVDREDVAMFARRPARMAQLANLAAQLHMRVELPAAR